MVRHFGRELGWTFILGAASKDGGVHTFNVTEPKFYAEVEKQLQGNSLQDIQTYLRWHVANASAPYLSSRFVKQDFEFYSHTLRGVREAREIYALDLG